ncbi:MAG: alpha/beta hydrolase, partial [Anaerolineae bacterium]
AGQTGVVFAHMVPTDQTGWTAMAQTLAGRGYLTLTFDFRGYGASGGQKEIGRIDRDLLAAAAFIRQQGATDVVLVGASMGGTAVAKVAALKPPAAAVIISAPRSFRGLAVSDEELAVAGVPRLFIGSRGDGATRDTLDMFNAAPGPKESHVYPGNAHGTFIFNSEHGADLSARLIRFIEANAPAR